MKKPKSKPAQTTDHLPPPPPNLGPTGRDLWLNIVREFELNDSGTRAVLAEACAAADMVAMCRERLARDGLTVPTKSGIRDHPLTRTLLMSQSFLTRSLIRIGVVDEQKNPIGRPPGRGNLGIDRTVTMRLNGREDA
jgi:hypothetical protein